MKYTGLLYTPALNFLRARLETQRERVLTLRSLTFQSIHSPSHEKIQIRIEFETAVFCQKKIEDAIRDIEKFLLENGKFFDGKDHHFLSDV